MVLTLRERLHKSDVRSQPRQGPKPGRKRRWRGFLGAPSGAGRGVSPRVPRIGAELGAWSRLRPADGVWGRGGRGDMFGLGSYGQPRVPGKYVNPHPRIRRSMVDWLDEPIDRNAERLFDLAAEFWGDECLVNFFGTKK